MSNFPSSFFGILVVIFRIHGTTCFVVRELVSGWGIGATCWDHFDEGLEEKNNEFGDSSLKLKIFVFLKY